MNHEPLAIIQSLVLLLFVVSTVATIAHRREWPLTVVLVIVGALLGIFHVAGEIHFSPELVLLVFLPPLLFEAAWNLHFDELKANALPVAVLAVGGVVISAGVVGAALALAGALPWGLALLFGAMVSATDPVSVVATFRQLGLSSRLATIIEAESLLNDGTAVVLFQVISAIVLAGGSAGVLGAVGSFAYIVAVGALVGVVVGHVISRMIIRIDAHLIEITLTTVAAYGTYLLAEHFHASGIIAVVFAALVIGNVGRPQGMTRSTQVAVEFFWEYAAFVANSLLFILVGTQMQPQAFADVLGPVAVAVAAVLLGRVVSVYPLVAITNRVGRPIKLVWQHVLVWGGLRGALSMALALSLPVDTPQRALLIKLVFGVVAFSLIVQGLTMGPWLKGLKADPEHDLAGPAPDPELA